jgi:probable phosphoglycerate mutase
MTKRHLLYLARHGETDWNAVGRLQGQTDIPLNDVGRAQARALADRLRTMGLAGVLSSDLSRARSTAEIVCGELGVPLVGIDPAFRERSFGVFEGLTHHECRERHPVEWARFADARVAPPGAESLDAVAARMIEGALRVVARGGGPALIVSHGRAIRELVQAVRGTPADPVPNAAVYRVAVEDGALVEATLLAG